MQYIVLDMEWNQAWPGSYSAKRLPEKFRGEVIQIGAVRVTDRQIVGDEFQVLIKPKVFRKLNKKVSSLTGIKDAQLAEHGIAFPEAMERFREWCGEDCVFLTWGFDDIGILKENMQLHGLDDSWVDRWYNAQMIFNSQTDGATAQKALKTAMQMAGVEATRPAHDALGDAYHTAILCTRLDLPKGIAEYGRSMQDHENGFHGAEIPGCIDRKVFHGLTDKAEALQLLGETENLCPKCQSRMAHGKWVCGQNRRYSTMSTCRDHCSFLLRVKLISEEDGLKAVRMIYEGNSDAAKTFTTVKPKVRRRKKHSSAET